VLVPPSPKFHCQVVGLLVDWSVKFTVRGAAPLLRFEVKLVAGLLPPPSSTIKIDTSSEVLPPSLSVLVAFII